MAKKVDPTIPSVNIGLVGHVDHGKTTLNYALTGDWTDTHSEEIKRGITIRIGYSNIALYKKGNRYTNTPEKGAVLEKTVSLVDAPGHETLMTTMLSGIAIMDAAILVIAANEACPQPQTREHLTALNISGMKNIIIVQNKIDLVTPEEAKKNYQQIKQFVKGTVAEHAPIIPVSAQQRVNIEYVLQAIQELDIPERDTSKEPLLLVARSFDINKPGTAIKNLLGGIIGGSLVRGEVKKGDTIEILPGLKRKGGYVPLITTITGLVKADTHLDVAGPGGLVGIMTSLDPALTKSDTIGGTVAGLKGKLPPTLETISLNVHMLERAVGTKEEVNIEPLKQHEPLLLTVGITRTVGTVTTAGKGKVIVELKIPVVAEKGDRVAISRQVSGRWRLIGWGEVE